MILELKMFLHIDLNYYCSFYIGSVEFNFYSSKTAYLEWSIFSSYLLKKCKGKRFLNHSMKPSSTVPFCNRASGIFGSQINERVCAKLAHKCLKVRCRISFSGHTMKQRREKIKRKH